MKRFALFLALLTPTLAEIVSHSAPWGYAGKHGPEHWHNLNPDYKLCQSGSHQSPVDLHSPDVTRTQQGAPTYNWKFIAKANATHNGHSIEVKLPPGQRLQWNGMEFEVEQFHFHTPSEHRTDNAFVDLELHFVSKQVDGERLLVSAIQFEVDEVADEALHWVRRMPLKKGEVVQVRNIDLPSILQHVDYFKDHYTYEGSLTVPPCSEGVHWVVASDHLHITPTQLKTLRKGLNFNARLITVAAGHHDH